ncbi:MAG: PEP-CTERM sorting domain-containing protein [Chthoniobacteraceae bacterium]
MHKKKSHLVVRNRIFTLHGDATSLNLACLKKSVFNVPLVSLSVLLGALMVFECTLEGAIVNNGGFELDATLVAPPDISFAPLTNWSPADSADGTTSVQGLDPNQYGLAPRATGSIAAAFTSTSSAPANSTASISQNVDTDSSKLYNLQLWIANPFQDPNARANLFAVIWNGVPVPLTLWNGNFAAPNPLNPPELAGTLGTYFVVAPGTDWFALTIQDLAPAAGPATQTNIKIAAQSNSYAILVDDVAVTETPEPSSVVLLLSGAALVGIRRKRRQQVS